MKDVDDRIAGIVFPFDQASLDQTCDTLATRWAKIIEAIAERAGVDSDTAERDVTDAGFLPDDRELTDVDWCDAVVAGSHARLSERGEAVYDDLDQFYAENRNAAMALADPACIGIERLGCLLAAVAGVKGALALIDCVPRLDMDRLVHGPTYFDGVHRLALLHLGSSQTIH